MKLDELDKITAVQIINQLRNGTPHRKHVGLYSSGLEDLMRGFELETLPNIATGSQEVHFVSGSWGSGKTHLFGLLAEAAYRQNFVVSYVEITSDETPFSRFDKVVASIAKNMSCAEISPEGPQVGLTMLLEHHLSSLASKTNRDQIDIIDEETGRLFSDRSIEADWRRAIAAYWATFRTGYPTIDEFDKRTKIDQFFTGQINRSSELAEFGIQTLLKQDNAHSVFVSLPNLVKALGYGGLLVLFDEADLISSTMRPASRNACYLNIKSLMDNSRNSAGICSIYAAVPPFFNDDRYGIRTHGPLFTRVGSPLETPPRSRQTIWNLEALDPEVTDFVNAAKKIRAIYEIGHPNSVGSTIPDDVLFKHISETVEKHSRYDAVNRWRVVARQTVLLLDHQFDGDLIPEPSESFRSALESFGD